MYCLPEDIPSCLAKVARRCLSRVPRSVASILTGDDGRRRKELGSICSIPKVPGVVVDNA